MLGKIGDKRTAAFRAVALCALILVSLFAYYTYSSLTGINETQDILKQQINELNQTNSNLQNQNNQLSSQLQAIQNQLLNNTQSLQANLDAMKANYSALQKDFLSSQNSLADLQEQQNTLQNKPQPTEPFNYLIYSNQNGNYIAENGNTLAIDYSGSSATKVCQHCIDTLASSNGGTIIIAGTLTLDGPLIIGEGKSNGSIEISGIGPAAQLIVADKQDGIDLVGNQTFGYGGPYHASIKDLVLTTGAPLTANT